MKAFIITLVVCLTWLQPVVAQNDADQVWTKFKNDTTNMYIFLDGLAASDSPNNYCQYVGNFLDICFSRGIEWNTLYEELEETVVPKSPEVTTYYAIELCKYAKSFSEIIKALNLVSKQKSFDNKTFNNVALYPDGTIVIALNYCKHKLDYGNEICDLIEHSSGDNITTIYDRWYQTFVYQPSGKYSLGVFKTKGKDDFYDPQKAIETDVPDMYIGFFLDKEGKKIGEKYKQYDSFAKMLAEIEKEDEKEAAREKAEAAQAQADFDKKNNDIEKRLVAKYGRKAYDSMANARPYTGMPEGLVRDLCIYCGDGRYRALYKYAYTLIKTGHKVYKETGYFSLAGVKAPYLIYTLNGRVTGWKY